MLKVILRAKPRLLNEGVVELNKHLDNSTLRELEGKLSKLFNKANEAYSRKSTSGRRRLYKDFFKFSYKDIAQKDRTAELTIRLTITKEETEELAKIETDMDDRLQDLRKPVLYLYVLREDLPLEDNEVENYISTVINHELVHLLDDDHSWSVMGKEYWDQSNELTAYTTEILSEIKKFLSSTDANDIREKEEIFKELENSEAKGQAFARLLSVSKTFSDFRDLDYEDDHEFYSEKNPQFKSWVKNLYKHLSPIIKKEKTDA